MILYYIILFLFPIVVQCQNGINSSASQFEGTVILSYQHAVTLLKSNIVNKLMNVNLTHVTHSLSNLTHEFYCTVQEIHLNMQQATQANKMIIGQTNMSVDQLLESVSQLENETRETTIFMNESNNTVEKARQNVQDAKLIV
ncbi:hypothetical protein I4U23_004584 [Adineta vaga]|nr:hypothetical protein I4U23_004584 [Adineta vaga]